LLWGGGVQHLESGNRVGGGSSIQHRVSRGARGDAPGTDQRDSIIHASTVGLDEAYMVGRQAESVAAGDGADSMATIPREGGPTYRVRYDKVPLEVVANSERSFPNSWNTRSRTDVTDDFVRYARPPAGRDWPSIPRVGGLQRFARREPIFADRTLDEYVPPGGPPMNRTDEEGARMKKRATWRPPALVLTLCVLVVVSWAQAAGRNDEGYPRVMQGPMVGTVTEHGALVWLRLSGEYPVVLEYGTDFALTSFHSSAPIVSRKSNDYTIVVALEGLEPTTEYFYRVLVNGEGDKYLKEFPPFRFKTAPKTGTATSFRVAFGSCPKFQDDRVQPIWPVISELQADLFLWIGDNIYGDSLDPDILREEYRRQRDVPGLQPLLRNTSHLAVWDDHDFALNNHDRTNPIKNQSLDVFKDYWANPSYGLPDVPGVFFSYTYGDVDFFFVDDRYFRDPNEDPDTATKTMLGAAQFEWLQAELRKSTAIFKVIVSGSGFSASKGEGGDSWAAFMHERDRLFDFIRDQEIAGVVLMSGDSHIGELNVIPWSDHGGYDLYDLVSSPLAQRNPDSWLHRRPERRIRPVYFRGSNVGVIDFIFDGSPRLLYRLIDIHGRSVWKTFELRADELVNGVTSWRDKVDNEELQRQQSYEAGTGYYEIEAQE
jgi:alkaline phosphatase D